MRAKCRSACREAGVGVWQSTVADAMPAGTYELKLKAKVTGDRPIRLKVAIEPSERSQAAPLSTEAPSWTQDP
jgi:hypothetical protein